MHSLHFKICFLLHISQVSNTPWLEMHNYVLSHTSVGVQSEVCEDEGKLSFYFQKTFHVSPFLDMDYMYHFSFSDLQEKAQVNIEMHKGDDLYFDAKVSQSGMVGSLINILISIPIPYLSPLHSPLFFSYC